MVKRLAEPTPKHAALLDHRPYHGVRLTPLGEQVALEVIRHHRLLELYLSQALGYSWDEVHSEADRLEHVISEQLEARIAAVLGNPRIDPHGDPIPGPDGTIAADPLIRLSELAPGQSAMVSRITDQSREVLRYLSELGLVPGAMLHVTDKSPLGDTVTVQIVDTPHTISATVALSVLVQGVG
jgi:DtxR family Mn-dependent transcriptional regulator